MSDQGGYLQEQDLIQEIGKEILGPDQYQFLLSGAYDYEGSDFPWVSQKDLETDIKTVLTVLARRQLLNDFGIEQIRKSGIKPPER